MTASIPELREPLVHPWRFRLGSTVYVRNHNPREAFRVVGGELWIGFPHLKLLDLHGNYWRVAQLECSPKPIDFRKG